MFLAVLKLIGTTSAEEILTKTNYLTYLEINACFELINEMKEDIIDMEFETSTKESSNSNIFTYVCLLYTSPSPRDGLLSRMPSSA